jgi:chemotaxis protein MotA
LEPEIGKIKDNFLRYAMIQIQQKESADHIKLMLNEIIESTENRHEVGILYFEKMAQYAPGLALVGTLIGLVQLLSNLDDPKTIGPNMAVALVSTFYGVGSSNLLFLPMSGRLRVASYAERVHKEILIEGILAIAKGELPVVVREKIYSMVTEADRKYFKKFEKST